MNDTKQAKEQRIHLRNSGLPGKNFDTRTYDYADLDLERAVAGLPDLLRLTLILFLMGHTQRSIAEHFVVHRSTIGKRMDRALFALRESL